MNGVGKLDNRNSATKVVADEEEEEEAWRPAPSLPATDK